MDMKSIEFKELVYLLMNGEIDLSVCPVKESVVVKDEFEEGKPCEKLYGKVYEANLRLCKRLGVEELDDDDVEEIINNCLDIAKHLSMKMYDYGAYFAQEELKNKEA